MSHMINTQEIGTSYSNGGHVTSSMSTFVMFPGTRQVFCLRIPRQVADNGDILHQFEYDYIA